MAHVAFTVSVCDCCLIKLANDDTSGHDYYCGDNFPPMRQYYRNYGARLNLVPVPGDDRTEFSSLPCEGCGSYLAGARTDCPVLAS